MYTVYIVINNFYNYNILFNFVVYKLKKLKENRIKKLSLHFRVNEIYET